MKRLILLTVLLSSGGCASTTIQLPYNCGSGKQEAKQTTTDSTRMDGNKADVSPNVSLVP